MERIGVSEAAATSKVASVSERLGRYLKTCLWLLRQNLIISRTKTFISLVVGIVARMGPLVGYLVAIRCAVWILAPETLPEAYANLFSPLKSYGLYQAPLVVFPLLTFAISALAQRINYRITLDLKTGLAEMMARRYTSKFASKELPTFDPGEDVAENVRKRQANVDAKKLTTEYRTCHSRVYRSEANFLNLLLSAMTLVLALLAGLVISPYIIGPMMSAAVGLALVVIWRRHAGAQNLEQRRVSNRETELAIFAAAQEKAKGYFVDGYKRNDIDNLLSPLAAPIAQNYEEREEFRSTSSLAISIGQSAIIVVFLLVLAQNPEAFRSQLGQLVIAILLIRFSFAAIQTASTAAVSLSQDYPFIVELSQSVPETRELSKLDNT